MNNHAAWSTTMLGLRTEVWRRRGNGRARAGRAMPVHRLEIGLRGWHLDDIADDRMERAVAADADVGATGADQRLGLWQDQALGNRWGRGCDRVGQALALIGVEHGEALGEWDGGRLVAVAVGAVALGLGDEAVGIDHRGAPLALADIASQRERLAEGEPGLAGVAALNDRAPEDQHVDPRIAPAGRGVLRQSDGHPGARGAPGLDPGQAPSLQLGDDLVGDFGIEARPVLTGTSASG